jgi:hypothetical protein
MNEALLGPRRIPIVLPPMPGEALDSWLAAYAARLRTAPRDLAAALRIDERFLRRKGRLVATGYRFTEQTSVAYVAGIDPAAVDRLYQPLARYERLTKTRLKRGNLQRAALPMPWSRYCPACLIATGGRWQAAWRLPWFLICPDHSTLLLSRCPACGRHAGRRPVRLETVLSSSSLCTWPARRVGGRSSPLCGQDLTNAPMSSCTDARVLDMERQLLVALDPDTEDSAAAGAVDRLADMLVIATKLSPGLTWREAEVSEDAAPRARILGQAWAVLTDPHGRELAELATRNAGNVSRGLPRGWTAASSALAGRVVSVLERRLTPVARLRWRTAASASRPS